MIDLKRAYESLKGGENQIWWLTERSEAFTSLRRLYSLAEVEEFLLERLAEIGVGSLESEHYAEILLRSREVECHGYRWVVVPKP